MSNTQQPAASFGGSDKQVRMPSSRHSWRRLHASTWGVAGAIVAILALIVVPGSPDNHGVFVSGPLFYEHGWPFVFLDRYFPSPPGRASPGDPLMKFLKNWRDEKGLRWATSGSEFWLWSENGFLHDGPAWLDATRWPIRGEALVSLAGLMLDLAVAFAISAGIASAYEWWAQTLAILVALFFCSLSPHCNRASVVAAFDQQVRARVVRDRNLTQQGA